MKILIASGIYPPDIGGPAQYARNLYNTWKGGANEAGGSAAMGTIVKHDVKVAAYRWERAFPPFVTHLLYFLKIIRKGWNADLILVLDTWSAAVPTMYACALMRKKYVLRTGGDRLWECYVERTGDLVLFKDFYATRLDKLSSKERLMYKLGGKALRNAKVLIFSTNWQRQIFEKAYKLDPSKSVIIENYMGEKAEPVLTENRNFVAGTRVLKWKNIDLLKSAFASAQEEVKNRGFEPIELDLGKAVYDSFFEKIQRSYAVILTSLGDISPNMIFDAIRAGTPFIVTKETGIGDRIKDCAIFVDPENEKDIKEKIVWLSDPKNRELQAEKVRKFAYTHTWENIGDEIIEIACNSRGKVDRKGENESAVDASRPGRRV